MVFVFLTTTLTLRYLGNSSYGIWTTIYSIISWIYLLDFGFSNVLKTELPTLSSKDKHQINILISTIYVGIAIIAIAILGCYLILGFVISYSEFLNISSTEVNFNFLLLINLLFSLSILIVGNYKSLFSGTLKTHLVEFSLMITQIIIYLLIYFISNKNLLSDYPKLLIVSMIFGITNLLVGTFFTFKFFRSNKYLNVSFSLFSFKTLKIKTNLGLKFFVIQTCMIIIFSTDYVLIVKYFGPEAVANYDLILKIFQVPLLLAIAGLSPFWSVFANKFAAKEFVWIKNTLVIYNYSFSIFIIAILVLNFFIDEIIYIWVGTIIDTFNTLLLTISFYVIFRSYTAMYNYFLNGINKINLTLYLTIFGAIINIPLCVLLIKTDIGVAAIVIGTCISIFPTTIILPIQSFSIINKKIKDLKNG